MKNIVSWTCFISFAISCLFDWQVNETSFGPWMNQSILPTTTDDVIQHVQAHVIRDLTPNTKYQAKVRASNSVGRGQFSDILTFSTAEGEAPNTIHCYTHTNNMSQTIYFYKRKQYIVHNKQYFVTNTSNTLLHKQYFVTNANNKLLQTHIVTHMNNILLQRQFFVTNTNNNRALLFCISASYLIFYPIPCLTYFTHSSTISPNTRECIILARVDLLYFHGKKHSEKNTFFLICEVVNYV